MFKSLPILSKESLKEITSYIDNFAWQLRYDANDTKEQFEAAEKLEVVKYFLAYLGDKILGYWSASYFLNEDQKSAYADFATRFKSESHTVYGKLRPLLSQGLEALSSIEYDELNRHRLPRRKRDIEDRIDEFFDTVDEHFDEILSESNTLNDDKEDGNKPSESTIRKLIESIIHIQRYMLTQGEQHNNLIQAFQFTKMLDMFKNPLLFGWEKYGYGWHSDFWKEGDSMFEYDMFLFNAEEQLVHCLEMLNSDSPFRYFEKEGQMTRILSEVLSDILSKLKSGEFQIS